MFNDFFTISLDSKPIILTSTKINSWESDLTHFQNQWLLQQPKPKNGDYLILPDAEGNVSKAIAYIDSLDDFWHFSTLAKKLPTGNYHLECLHDDVSKDNLCLAWGLAFYKFDKYKKHPELLNKPCLVWPTGVSQTEILAMLDSITLVRKLITTPACDMGPEQLSNTVKELSKLHKAKYEMIEGEALLKKNFPAIYMVGKAAMEEPRLVTMHWQSEEPKLKLALVGKGVCFDTGGLDLKPSNSMLLMKKDMGGAANVIGLAKLIMSMHLPVDLSIYLPIVENAISEQAMRPLDICHTRKGITIEIGNTDAEGRLILADALTYACEEKPDLIIDLATLTGAARVAVGEISAFFTNNHNIAQKLQNISINCADYMWQLPLHKEYRQLLKSSVADISSTGSIPVAGSITAALFLREFIDNSIDWVHVDMMAYNKFSRPGRPEGGEAASIRTIYRYIKDVIKNVNSNKK